MTSTTRYRRGDIVLVPFPIIDLSSAKRRPALVVSPDTLNQQTQDVVSVAITSNLTGGGNQIIVERLHLWSLPKESGHQTSQDVHHPLFAAGEEELHPATRNSQSRSCRDPAFFS